MSGIATLLRVTRFRLLPLAMRLVVQIGLLFVILQAYSLFRKQYFLRSPAIAFEHAQQVIRVQRAIGLSVHRIELPLQQRVLEHPWLIDFFNSYYQYFKTAFLASAVLCLVFAPLAYPRIRALFLVATLIALPWYALYPLAPPRFMEPYGYPFIDTLAVYGGVQSTASGLGGANQYAAMPSMHIGWTVIAALWLSAALPWRRIGAVLGGAHVTLMCLTVMVTGNHFLLDIVGGFVVVGVAAIIVRRLPIDLFGQARMRLTRRMRRALVNSPASLHGRSRLRPPRELQ